MPQHELEIRAQGRQQQRQHVRRRLRARTGGCPGRVEAGVDPRGPERGPVLDATGHAAAEEGVAAGPEDHLEVGHRRHQELPGGLGEADRGRQLAVLAPGRRTQPRERLAAVAFSPEDGGPGAARTKCPASRRAAPTRPSHECSHSQSAAPAHASSVHSRTAARHPTMGPDRRQVQSRRPHRRARSAAPPRGHAIERSCTYAAATNRGYAHGSARSSTRHRSARNAGPSNR